MLIRIATATLLLLTLSTRQFGFSQVDFWTKMEGADILASGNVWSSPNGGLYTIIERTLFRSTDGGNSWNSVSVPCYGVLAMLFANGNMFVGAGDEDLLYGCLLRSSDNGDTWTWAGFGPPEGHAAVGSLRINSKGHIFAKIHRGGFSGGLRSTNNGESWMGLESASGGDHFSYLIGPDDVIYTVRDPGRTSPSSRPGGWLRSLDDGVTWKAIAPWIYGFLISEHGVIIGINFLYADSTFIRSTDHGDSWNSFMLD